MSSGTINLIKQHKIIWGYQIPFMNPGMFCSNNTILVRFIMVKSNDTKYYEDIKYLSCLIIKIISLQYTVDS